MKNPSDVPASALSAEVGKKTRELIEQLRKEAEEKQKDPRYAEVERIARATLQVSSARQSQELMGKATALENMAARLPEWMKGGEKLAAFSADTSSRAPSSFSGSGCSPAPRHMKCNRVHLDEIQVWNPPWEAGKGIPN